MPFDKFGRHKVSLCSNNIFFWEEIPRGNSPFFPGISGWNAYKLPSVEVTGNPEDLTGINPVTSGALVQK